jgi:hypothetical protein
VAAAVIAAAAQPIVAEDTWWHLAIGRVYAASGPWLAADPFLYTAPGPPAPAAWASDVALYAIERALGFTGLRALHALLVAAALAAAWIALARASRSRTFASFGTALFAALAAYRLFQLRPELATILGTLALLGALAREPRTAPTRMRLAAIAAGFALWANLHGGFVLGLALLGAAALAVAVATRGRELGLAAAWLAAFAGSLVNPQGVRAHGLYFAAGSATPDLAMIVDEWAPLRLFALPVANRPPSLASWAIVWALWLATPIALLWFARARRTDHTLRPLDPALLGVAAVGLVAPLAAVRLAWLGIAPLVAIARASRAVPGSARRAATWSCAGAALLLAIAFARVGDWPVISSGIEPAVYARPYPPEKYYAHPVWFLRDAGLEGRLWNDYLSGNFLSYWLAPRLRVFVNGSLNVPPALFAEGAAIRARAASGGETVAGRLDRLGVDVFFAIGTPIIPRANHAGRYSTSHLEDTPGWLTVFRNADSAVYLRSNDRNRANLARVAAYYRRESIPFDLVRGFDVRAAIAASPHWAAEHGILPADWRDLDAAARAPVSSESAAARGRIATLYALLGLYDQAIAIDRDRLAREPRALPAARRLVWSLLHVRRDDELASAAKALEAIAPAPGTLAYALAAAARRVPTQPGDAAREIVAGLPMFTEYEARQMLATFSAPPARTD